MRADSAWSAMALLALLCGPLSLPAEAGALDTVDAQRNECLLQRIRSSPAGAAPSSGCFRLTDPQREFMENRRREFCEDPGQFCISLRPTPGSDRSATLRRLFVSPRCETLPPRSGDANPNADHNAMELVDYVTDDNGGDSQLKGDRFVGMMRSAWGCSQGEMRVVNGDRGVEFRKQYDCDPEKMPFDCPSGRAKTPSSPDSGFEGRRQLSNIAFAAAGAVLARQGDRCVIQSTESATSSITSLPLLARPGDTYESFAARLSTPEQRAELRHRTALAERGARRIFNSAAVLLGADSGQFRLAARAVATPDRVALARRSMEAARQAVIDYLGRLDPPAPEAVIDRVRHTRLNDLDAFNHQPPSAEDQKTMEAVEEGCKEPGQTFGVSNSFNHSHIDSDPTVSICPRQLLEMDLSTPDSLISLLAHELGHSVDPCELGQMAPEVRACMSLPPLDSAQSAQVQQYTTRMNGPDGYVSCLHRPVPPSNASPIHGGNPALSKALFDAIQKDGPDCQKFDDEEKCEARFSGPGSPLQFCSRNFSRASLDPVKCPTASKLIEGLKAQPVEQAQETYADFVSSQALMAGLGRSVPGWSQMERPERTAEILTTLSHWCLDEDVPDSDEHSQPGARAATFAADPSIRSELGCSAAPADPGRFPGAACAARLPVRPAH